MSRPSHCQHGIDWQRHQAVVSKHNLEEIQPCGIREQKIHQGHIKEASTESDKIPPRISTFSANSISSAQTLHTLMFWGGLCLFWLIRSAVGAPQDNHYIIHPAKSPLLLSPSPSVVLVVVMMMCVCGDSMTDPVAVYVWVWLICLIWVCPQGVSKWDAAATPLLLLLRYLLDSDILTVIRSILTLENLNCIYWTCCGYGNKNRTQTSVSIIHASCSLSPLCWSESLPAGRLPLVNFKMRVLLSWNS